MFRRLILALITVLGVAGSANAHLASDSYLRIEIGSDGQVSGQWDIALRDLDVALNLDADQDGTITWGELRGKTREVEAYVLGRLSLARGGRACRLTPTALMVDYHASSAYAVLPFMSACPLQGRLSLHYELLFDIDPSHRGLLTIATGEKTSSDVLTPEHQDVVLDRDPEGLGEQTVRFLRFGFEHILLGYDHLLFISVLLITAAMHRRGGIEWVAVDHLGRVLVETIKTLTAFTLAHAAVLTAATLHTIDLTARLVEPAVAVTIMLAALDNVRPILPRLRWQIAFLFGLIHGLSFASAIGPMQLPPLALAIALGSFNLGVEGAQIALALLLVPIVFSLRYEAAYRRLISPAVSIGVLLLAGIWFLDRVFVLDLLSFQPTAVAASVRSD
jgi:hypothetical protein